MEGCFAREAEEGLDDKDVEEGGSETDGAVFWLCEDGGGIVVGCCCEQIAVVEVLALVV